MRDNRQTFERWVAFVSGVPGYLRTTVVGLAVEQGSVQRLQALALLRLIVTSSIHTQDVGIPCRFEALGTGARTLKQGINFGERVLRHRVSIGPLRNDNYTTL